MKLLDALYQVKGKFGMARHHVGLIAQLVNDPKLSLSYFPQSERKAKLSIWLDNFLWLAKHGEVNHYYYVYGLDRKSTATDTELLSYNEFKRIRDSKNKHANQKDYNYICLLRDKFIFSQLLSSLQFPTVKNLALFNRDKLTWLNSMKTMSLQDLLQDTALTIDGFCKKLDGTFGEGAFPLQIQAGKLYIKNTEITLQQLLERTNGQYLLQERITQHPQMSSLHPDSVNTMRMVTFNNEGKVEVFCAAARIGTKARSVDNWSAGGILAGIDIQTGKLQKEGIYKPGYGGRITHHPDTGIQLQGFSIPYFKQSMELACKLHSYFYGMHSVGWDIAITQQGPVFVEGNDSWDGAVAMAIEKNFKSRFLQMYAAT